MLWYAWTILRNTRKRGAELLEDRYGMERQIARTYFKGQVEPSS